MVADRVVLHYHYATSILGLVPKVKPVKLARNILSMPNNRVEKMLNTKRIYSLMGLLLIGVLMISSGSFGIAKDVIGGPYLASFNGGGITQHQFDHARQSLPDPESSDAAVLLDFLIDEALLVERVKALGFVESDATIRKALSRSMIDAASRQALLETPSDADLKTYYLNHQALFQRSAKTRIKVYLLKTHSNISEEEASKRLALEVRDRLLQQENIDDAVSPYVSPLPSSLVNVEALPKYIGPSLGAAAAILRAGDISQPIIVGKSVYLIACEDYVESRTLAFADVKNEVLLEFQRRKRDEVLRELLDRLWNRADINVANQLGFTLKDMQRGGRNDG